MFTRTPAKPTNNMEKEKTPPRTQTLSSGTRRSVEKPKSPPKTQTLSSNVRRSVEKLEASGSELQNLTPATSKIDIPILPRQVISNRLAEAKANVIKAKTNINNSRNIKTDIKMSVLEAVDKLFQLVKEADTEIKRLKKTGETSTSHITDNSQETLKTTPPREAGESHSLILAQLKEQSRLLVANGTKMDELKEKMDQQHQLLSSKTYAERSKLATDELHLTAQAKGISVALVQEPYVGRTGVMKQSPGTQVIQCSLNRQKPVKAAIVIFGSSLEVIHDPQLVTENIVAVLLKVGQLSIGVLSVYFEGDQELHPYLSALQHTTHKLHTNNILVGGDVNAWSQWWGSVSENHRGAEYCSFLHEQDFQILNSGQTPTFEIYRGDRWCTSIVDVTACSLSLLGKMEEWRVERGLTSSDHNAITFSMRLEKALEPLRPVSTRIYNTRKAKWSEFGSHLKANLTEKQITKVRISNALGPEDLENILEEYTNAIHCSCDEAIPKLGSPKYSAKPPWWNSTLDLLKKDAVRKKRRIRNAAAHRREYTIEIYVTAKNKYTLAATEAATASWREFCTRQDRESMWDGIYRVLRKTARRQENTLLRNTAAQLITTEYARLEDWTPETLETHRVTGPQIYTDGSKIEGKVGAALTWWEGGKESMSSTFGLEPHNTVFQSEMYALFRAVRLAKESRAASISILSDSRSSLDLLKRPSVTHHLALQIKSCLSEIREEGRKVRLFWLKAHVGTAGNERADELAKQAALTKETADYDKVPVSYVRRKIREGTVKKWQARYESSSTGAVTKVFFPDVLAAKRILRDTVLTPAHTQILTGHGGFAAYLHRFHLKNSPSCVCDQSCEETVWHLLFECPSSS
ncbi:hypothetical protein PYW07_014968 [Mythimna separata]|uniref:RNase H type-1 domain-containing protein n=1 Tax=Mythimna separata TaxID=271217 RepID=A0AAD7YZC5_MYTSE|nr:hypothetical protein PYW07_014968 [Mythimna separata]